MKAIAGGNMRGIATTLPTQTIDNVARMTSSAIYSYANTYCCCGV